MSDKIQEEARKEEDQHRGKGSKSRRGRRRQ